MAQQTKFARDLAVGDRVYGPNARLSQQVEALEAKEQNGVVCMSIWLSDSIWVVPQEHEIRTEVEDGE